MDSLEPALQYYKPVAPPYPYHAADLRDGQGAWHSGGVWSAVFVFEPTAEQKLLRNGMDKGVLHILCKDLRALMKEGFFWSPQDNVVPERGFYEVDEGCSIGEERYSRHWFLKRVDAAPRPPGGRSGKKPASRQSKTNWVGHFVAYAGVAYPTAFRLRDLNRDDIVRAAAWNPEGRAVYSYVSERAIAIALAPDDDDDLRSNDNFNAICNNAYLGGWWPWPKGRRDRDRARRPKAKKTARKKTPRRRRTLGPTGAVNTAGGAAQGAEEDGGEGGDEYGEEEDGDDERESVDDEGDDGYGEEAEAWETYDEGGGEGTQATEDEYGEGGETQGTEDRNGRSDIAWLLANRADGCSF